MSESEEEWVGVVSQTVQSRAYTSGRREDSPGAESSHYPAYAKAEAVSNDSQSGTLESNRPAKTAAEKAAAKAAAKRRKLAKADAKLLEMKANSEKARLIMQEGRLPFIAIDVESWERDHSKLTEIGWTVMEAGDLTSSRPLDSCRTRHVIVKEYVHLLNGRFVHGNRDHFLWGASERLSLIDTRRALQKDLDRLSERHGSYVVVFHDAAVDLKYLEALGITLPTTPESLLIIDTAEVYAARQDTTYERVGLGKLSSALGLSVKRLHNAGNDAQATMQLLLFLFCPEKVQTSTSVANAPVYRIGLDEPVRARTDGPESSSDESLP